MDSGRGLVHVYHGDGKGKTSAALGLALRCAGRGGPVTVARFLKGADSGEAVLLRRLPNVILLDGPAEMKFTWQMTGQEQHEAALRCAQLLESAFRDAASARLLVLDEVLDACRLGLLAEEALCARLDDRPPGLEVALTGRGLTEALAARGDYITRMVKERHPFDAGTPARAGIEF